MLRPTIVAPVRASSVDASIGANPGISRNGLACFSRGGNAGLPALCDRSLTIGVSDQRGRLWSTAAPAGRRPLHWLSRRLTAMWERVVGQERAVGLLQRAAERPVHAYLLVGPRSSGLEDAARCFAADVID